MGNLTMIFVIFRVTCLACLMEPRVINLTLTASGPDGHERNKIAQDPHTWASLQRRFRSVRFPSH
jgi:hypothetical protein